MVFSSKNKSDLNLVIRIDGESVNEVKKTELLDVIIDKWLSWKDHISYISGKIARGIGVIVKDRKDLLKNYLINLYHSFKGLRPVLEGFVVPMHEGACVTGSQIPRA